MADDTDLVCWDDLPVGAVRDLGRLTVSEEEIIAFARQFDPQPFHLSQAGGEASLFGGLCASGWHTCSLAMRLMVTNFLSRSTSLGSPGLEGLKWRQPVRPGDTLALTLRVVDARPMASRPDVGLVRNHWEMTNQHGAPVLFMDGWGMFRRRHPATPGPSQAQSPQ